MLVQIQPTPKLTKDDTFRTGLPPSLILLSLSGGTSASSSGICDHVFAEMRQQDA